MPTSDHGIASSKYWYFTENVYTMQPSWAITEGRGMEALRELFNAIVGRLPQILAGLIQAFVGFPFFPYAASLRAVQLLRVSKVPSIALVAVTFLMFALFLGVPTTRALILSFDGGLTKSLRLISKIDTKGRDFLYLTLFVLSSTVFTIIIGNTIKAALNLRRTLRSIFSDILNVFVAYTVGWFLFIALLLAALFNFRPGKETQALTSAFFHDHGIADISQVIISPALLLIVLLSMYFGYRIIQQWGSKKNVLELIRRKDTKEAFNRTKLMVFPAVVSFLSICFPALILAMLCDALYWHARSLEYQISCAPLGGNRLFISLAIKNNETSTIVLKPVYISLRKGVNYQSEPIQQVKLDVSNFVWASRKGILVEPSEVRYLRILGAFDKLNTGDVVSCSVDNRFNDVDTDNDQPERVNLYRPPSRIISVDGTAATLGFE
jgi:hypothetical protein